MKHFDGAILRAVISVLLGIVLYFGRLQRFFISLCLLVQAFCCPE